MMTKVNNSEQLVRLLTTRRKELGISQADLARLCNLSMNGISKLESQGGQREIKLSTLFKLGEVLGLRLCVEFEE